MENENNSLEKVSDKMIFYKTKTDRWELDAGWWSPFHFPALAFESKGEIDNRQTRCAEKNCLNMNCIEFFLEDKM